MGTSDIAKCTAGAYFLPRITHSNGAFRVRTAGELQQILRDPERGEPNEAVAFV